MENKRYSYKTIENKGKINLFSKEKNYDNKIANNDIDLDQTNNKIHFW